MIRRPWRSLLFASSTTAIAVAYLFVQAPPPLAAGADEHATVPIGAVFAMLEHENDAARQLWTSEIVNAGRAHGLAFGEDWRDAGVAKGPLPALFLRDTASHLERTAPGLRLFLGSEYPINPANQFSGSQAAYFRRLATTGAPQRFFEASTGLHTAMFADRAVVDACVRCHDDHPRSPKTDWKLHDIMGATTWMYPDELVTMDRAVDLIGALRASIRAAYASYLAKAATFPDPPHVGDGWPRDGRQLPSEDVFMAELARRSSTGTLQGILEPGFADQQAELPPPVAPPTPPPAPPPPAAPSEDALVVTATRAMKIVIEHDGSTLVVARLHAGTRASVSSPPPLKIRADDPAALTVEYGGKPIAPPDVEVVADEDE